MIEISKLSSRYDVRRMSDEDADEILDLCSSNGQYYLYSQAKLAREQVLDDLHITPPGTDLSDKYYIGFNEGDALIAVMDLIDGYPQKEIAFIGFFMMNKKEQGRGIGSDIISEVSEYLKRTGKTSIRLGIDKDNPQSNQFWKKNGFKVIEEVEREGHGILYAEKRLE